MKLDETGITNLGPVPEGLTFLEATKALTLKHRINPDHHSKRLTVCETQREIWRIADGLPEPVRSDLKALAAAGYHYGKCMDLRMKQLKAMLADG
ncbi:hypothetical protein APY04_0824 [Hyphomicrobium sulfonivorans]|uniref:Uncharacterized protein n=1 Tax=Hyphomicrobium sulfonivorans TaxID=121290 RepID=A0A109BKZ1_HYPSL|nr:hypothetical protein [Hyphomicrobium sulfonivorans]KWT70763.1 hypothetical protein APY04_0824 [Hyphomicrobium sulfonivorans]